MKGKPEKNEEQKRTLLWNNQKTTGGLFAPSFVILLPAAKYGFAAPVIINNKPLSNSNNKKLRGATARCL